MDSKSVIQSVMHSDKQAMNIYKSTNLHTVKLFDAQGRPHPFPLTKDYILKEC